MNQNEHERSIFIAITNKIEKLKMRLVEDNLFIISWTLESPVEIKIIFENNVESKCELKVSTYFFDFPNEFLYAEMIIILKKAFEAVDK